MNMLDKTFQSEKNVRQTLQVLKMLLESLDRHGIKYYLDFGTLIGAVRENRLIPWDYDVDITLSDPTDSGKLREVLRELRLKSFLRTYTRDLDGCRDKWGMKEEDLSFAKGSDFQIAKVRNSKFLWFGRGRVCIDIFFKYEYQGYLYWVADGCVNRVPSEFLDGNDLQSIDFYGLKCNVPRDYDRYLTHKYGDWRTPKRDWGHEKDDLSIVKCKSAACCK